MFLQHWWLDAVCENWDAAISMNGEQVAGVWPYDIQSRMGVSLLRNPKLLPYMGPAVLYPADLKAANRDSFEYDTMAALAAQLPAAKVWDLALQPGIKQAGLFKQKGMSVEVRQTFLLKLDADETTLLADCKESLRRNIKATDNNAEIVNDPSLLPLLFEYQKQTLERKDVLQSYTLQDMQKLMQAAIENNSAALLAFKQGADVQALVWNVWDAERSYYFMGAQKPGNDNYRAMPQLLWHCITTAKQRGNTVFDFEGSMDPGVEKFFRSFGAARELYLVLKKNDSLLWKLKGMVR